MTNAEKERLRQSAYYRSFLQYRDKYRWLREPREIELRSRRRSIIQVNDEEDIRRGYALRRGPFGLLGGALSDCTDGTIFRNLSVRDDAQNGYWLHLFYQDFADHLVPFLDFIRFDLDRHGPDDEQVFWDQVRAIENMALETDCKTLWTTSPGRIIEGEHIQGLYAWIKLSEELTLDDITDLTRRVVQQFEISAEATWVSGRRGLRIPGQRWVEMCAPVSDHEYVRTIEPPSGRNVDRFFLVVDAWETLKPLNPEEIALGVTATITRKRRDEYQHDYDLSDTASIVRTLVGHHLRSLGKDRLDEVQDRTYEDACRLLSEVRPTSETLNQGELLPLISRYLRAYMRGFNPDNCGSYSISALNNALDKRRFEHTRGMQKDDLIRCLPDELSEREREITWLFYELCCQYEGRVHHKEIYEIKTEANTQDGRCDGSICSHYEWLGYRSRGIVGLKEKLIKAHVIEVLNDYEPVGMPMIGEKKRKGKCRQYGFTKQFVNRVRNFRQ